MDRFAIDQRPGVAAPAFFVPGGDDERAYAALRSAAGDETGRAAKPRRIFSISCRVAGRDCEIAVGAPDPVGGATVLAIFDVGGNDRYVVLTERPGAGLRLGRHVYGVCEFESAG